MFVIFEEYRSLYEWVQRNHSSWNSVTIAEKKPANAKNLWDASLFRKWSELLDGLIPATELEKLKHNPARVDEFLDAIALHWLAKFQVKSMNSYEIVTCWQQKILPLYTLLYIDRLRDHRNSNTLIRVEIRRQTSRLLKLLLLDRLIQTARLVWSNLANACGSAECFDPPWILRTVIELRVLLSVLKIQPESLAQFLRSRSMNVLQLYTFRDEFFALLGLTPKQRHGLLRRKFEDASARVTENSRASPGDEDLLDHYDGYSDSTVNRKHPNVVTEKTLDLISIAADPSSPLHPYSIFPDLEPKSANPAAVADENVYSGLAPHNELKCDTVVIQQLLEMFSNIGERSRKIADISDKTNHFLAKHGYRLCKNIEILMSSRRTADQKVSHDLLDLSEINLLNEVESETSIPTCKLSLSRNVAADNSDRVIGVFISLFGSNTNNFLLNMATLIIKKLLEKAQQFDEPAVVAEADDDESGGEGKKKNTLANDFFFSQCRELLNLIGCKATIQELPEYAVCEQLLEDEAAGWWTIGAQYQTFVVSRFPMRVPDPEDLTDGIKEEDQACMGWLDEPCNPLRKRLRELKSMYDMHNHQRSLMYDVSQSQVRLKLSSKRDNVERTQWFTTDILKAEIIILINSESDSENAMPLSSKVIANRLNISHPILMKEIKLLESQSMLCLDEHNGQTYVKLAVF